MELNNEEILAGNRAIAEFMGLIREEANHHYNKAQYYYIDARENHKRFFHYEDGLPYDKEWQYLMPVVEKIEKLGLKSSITFNGDFHFCHFATGEYENEKRVASAMHTNKLTAVWQAVINFIKFNNEKAAM